MRPEELMFSDGIKVLGRPIAYYPSLSVIIGSTNAGIFLSQFMYWEGKQADREGWIYKTQDELKGETGLSRFEQESARKALRDLDILEEKKKGVPARLHYRINWKAMEKVLLSHVTECEFPADKDASFPQTSMFESLNQESEKPAGKSASKHQRITESTIIEHSKTTADASKKLYSAFIDVHNDFCKSILGVGGKYDAAQGKAMKEIIAYLVKASEGDEEKAMNSWKHLCSKDVWSRLPEFYQSQVKLTQINSNMMNIISSLKSKNTGKSLKDQIRHERA